MIPETRVNLETMALGVLVVHLVLRVRKEFQVNLAHLEAQVTGEL